MTDPPGESADSFFGLEPRWLTWDRLYLVYVSEQMLAGARVAGQIYDERSASIQLQAAGPFLRPFVRRQLARRREREAQYAAMDPLSPSFGQQDPLNFQLRRSDVARTCFRRNRSYWTPYNVGRLDIELMEGSPRKLILVGDQDPEAIVSLLRTFDLSLEVTGKPNPLPKPKPVSAASRRRGLAVMATMLFLLGAIFSVAAFVVPSAPPSSLPIAGLNVLAGVWLLVRARKVGKGDAQEPVRAEER